MKTNQNFRSANRKWNLWTLSFLLCSYVASAQSPVNTYLGLGASFGVRHQKLNSDIKALDKMVNLQEGGSLILTGGNQLIKAKFETGFYFSAPSVPHTIDVVELNGNINFYPLQVLSKRDRRFEPYTIAGISRGQHKYYGFYNSDGKDTRVNYSTSQEPYLGKSVVLQSTYGLGLEYKLSYGDSFIHLFAEARNSKPFGFDATSDFENTRFGKSMAMNIGVVFGRKSGGER